MVAPVYYCWSGNEFSFTCTLHFTVCGKLPYMGTAKQYIFELSNFSSLVRMQGWLPHLISIKVGLDVAARALKHDQSAVFKIQPSSEGRLLEITLPSQNINLWVVWYSIAWEPQPRSRPSPAGCCNPIETEMALPSECLSFKLTIRGKKLGEGENYSSFTGSEIRCWVSTTKPTKLNRIIMISNSVKIAG